MPTLSSRSGAAVFNDRYEDFWQRLGEEAHPLAA